MPYYNPYIYIHLPTIGEPPIIYIQLNLFNDFDSTLSCIHNK